MSETFHLFGTSAVHHQDLIVLEKLLSLSFEVRLTRLRSIIQYLFLFLLFALFEVSTIFYLFNELELELDSLEILFFFISQTWRYLFFKKKKFLFDIWFAFISSLFHNSWFRRRNEIFSNLRAQNIERKYSLKRVSSLTFVLLYESDFGALHYVS